MKKMDKRYYSNRQEESLQLPKKVNSNIDVIFKNGSVDVQHSNPDSHVPTKLSTSIEPDKISTEEKKICEGFGCFETLITDVEIQVGTFGSMIVSLCKNCATRVLNTRGEE
jgi:hypothetical protein